MRTHTFLAFVVAAAAALSAAAAAEENPPENEDAWASIRSDLFGQREIADGAETIALDAPDRALDAAVVPITVRMAPRSGQTVKALTIIVDENPSPVAAKFDFGEAAGDGERIMATRIRVDRYTFVRAVAEMDDGRLLMARKFVKASGGCSAPASKDPEEAEKSLGKMRIRPAAAPAPSGQAIAEVMIRHPNTSGMVMDQITKGYPPARFISKLAVDDGGKMIFSMEGGISISEDPYFRFTYKSKGDDVLNVTAEDSTGERFTGHSNNPA